MTSVVIDLTDTSDDESDKEGSKKRPIDGSSSSRKKKKTFDLKDFKDFETFHDLNKKKSPKPKFNEEESLKELLTKNPLKFERFSIVGIKELEDDYVVCNIYANTVKVTKGGETNYVFTGFAIGDLKYKIEILEKLHAFMEKETSFSDRLKYYEEEYESGYDLEHNITELDLEPKSAPIITGSSWLSRFDKNDKEIVIRKIKQEIEKQMNTSSNSKKPTVEQLTLIKLKF